jgi:hypothetical protein
VDERFWNKLAQVFRLVRELVAMIDAHGPGSPAFGVVAFITEKESNVGDITVVDSDQPFTGTATFLDAKGAVTTPDTVPVWSSDNEAAATVVASDDGMTGTVTPGLPGAAVISVETTETNTGATVTAQGTVTVQPGDTVIGSVDFTPPAPPAPPEPTPGV